jgi:hypothetical protein
MKNLIYQNYKIANGNIFTAQDLEVFYFVVHKISKTFFQLAPTTSWSGTNNTPDIHEIPLYKNWFNATEFSHHWTTKGGDFN